MKWLAVLLAFSLNAITLMSLRLNGDLEATATKPKYAYITMWWNWKNKSFPLPAKGNFATIDGQFDVDVEDQDVSNPNGIMRLAKELSTSKYPLAVVTNTPELFDPVRKLYPRLEIVPITKDDIVQRNCKMWPYHSHWEHTFQKVQIFKLTQYDKLMWMDADIKINENVDDLFEYDLKNGTAIYGQHDMKVSQCQPSEHLCSGVLLFQPSKTIYDAISYKLYKKGGEEVYCPSDQPIIEKVYREKGEVNLLPLDVINFHTCTYEYDATQGKTRLSHHAYDFGFDKPEKQTA